MKKAKNTAPFKIIEKIVPGIADPFMAITEQNIVIAKISK
jgi:hypothetical protein